VNTKEAIEWIKTKVFCVDTMGNEKKLRDFEFNQDCVIALLKRGEAYEKMWEEDAKNWLGNDLDLEEWMNDTKQKYFPKEAKQDKS